MLRVIAFTRADGRENEEALLTAPEGSRPAVRSFASVLSLPHKTVIEIRHRAFAAWRVAPQICYPASDDGEPFSHESTWLHVGYVV